MKIKYAAEARDKIFLSIFQRNLRSLMLGDGCGEKQFWLAQGSTGGYSVRSFHTARHIATHDPYKLITYFSKHE